MDEANTSARPAISSADINYSSLADVSDVRLDNLAIDPAADPAHSAAGYDDLLKLSNAKRVQIHGLTVRGGSQRENAIDLNRTCEDVVIDGAALEAGSQNAITIKGGCRRITLRNIVIVRAGGHCDIELGNWSDQSFAPVTEVRLENVTRADGKPVRLRVVQASMPTIVGGNVRYLRLESLLLKAYWLAKRVGRALHLV